MRLFGYEAYYITQGNTHVHTNTIDVSFCNTLGRDIFHLGLTKDDGLDISINMLASQLNPFLTEAPWYINAYATFKVDIEMRSQILTKIQLKAIKVVLYATIGSLRTLELQNPNIISIHCKRVLKMISLKSLRLYWNL